MNDDQLFAELVARGFCTAAQAAEAGHPVNPEGRRRRSIHWANSSDPDVRAAFEAGRLQGIDEADRDLIAALAQMLGTNKTKTVRSAADWHSRNKDRTARRLRVDAGDPDLLEELAANSQRVAAANQKRDLERLAAAEKIPPVRGWEAWRDFCSPSVWERIVNEYAEAGRPLPAHLTGRRHLRAVA